MHTILVFFAMLLLGGCSYAGGERPVADSCGGEAMVETQLFFGMSRPTGGEVTQDEWDEFLQSEVVPRFAEGFAVFENSGFWLDSQSNQTIREPSRMISRLLRPGDAEEIPQITDAYKKRFDQESVLRIDTPVCAKFQ